MKHIAIFNNSGDVQTAIENEALLNPYVAKVSGALDYNTLQPAQPCYLGEWSDDGNGHYTFQILEPLKPIWENVITIGKLVGVYFNGSGPVDVDVTLSTVPGSGDWSINYVDPEQSENINHTFTEGTSEFWECSEVMTDPEESTATISIAWNGTDSLTFGSGIEFPLSMTTINPECE